MLERRDLDELKNRVNLRAFAKDRYGVELDAKGWGRCPRYERHKNGDAKPSFQHSRNILKCWSQKCFGENGVDVFGLVMEMESLDFTQARQIIEKYAGMRSSMSETASSPLTSSPGLDNEATTSSSQLQKMASYEYRNRAGDLLYTIDRLEGAEGKTFTCRPMGVSTEERVIYRLPEMIDGKDPVVIPEGEKCVDILRTLGYTAICSPFGAGKWLNQYSECLRDRHVVVWPDNDEPGKHHGEDVSRSIAGVAASVSVIELPDWLPPGGDVEDVIELRPENQVHNLVKAASTWVPPVQGVAANSGDDNPLRAGLVLAEDVEAKEVTWTWYPYIPRQFVTMIYGDGDVRKSWLAMAIAAGVTRGGKISPWDQRGRPPGSVLYFSGEDSVEHSLKPKAQGADADQSRLYLRYGAFSWDDDTLTSVEQILVEIQPELVVFDPLVSFQADVKSNEANQVRAGMERLGAIAKRQDCSVLLVHHVGKDLARGVDQLHLGSADYRNASRSTLFVGRTDPTDETQPSMFAHRKHNVSPRRGQSIEFTTEEPWRFRWVGVSDRDVEALYPVRRRNQRQSQAVDEVGDFLKDLLKDGPMPVKEIFSAAKDAGLSEKAVRTARERVCKKPRRNGTGWEWSLND